MAETIHIAGLRGALDELAAATDDELADRIVDLALSLRAPGPQYYAPLAKAAGLPLGEVLASPYSLRAIAMAVDVGATAIHHDVRRVIPWAEELRGHEDVISGNHGQWSSGVLEAGKYEAFLQEEPLSVYNPNHMSKWGPHELLHRVCRFFWRQNMSRWELYLGARLNEVIPVVHWYGMDEILRLDRVGFSIEVDTAAPNATLERAQWLTVPETELRARAEADVAHLRAGLAHFQREMDAIDEEIATGQRVRIEDAVLDSSSDATAYVVGHWTRLKRPSMNILCTEFLDCGQDFHDGVHQYREVIGGLFDDLLCAPLELDLERCAVLCRRRLAWDTLIRTTLLGPVGEQALAELATQRAEPGLPADNAGFDRLEGRLSDLLEEASGDVDHVEWDGEPDWVLSQGVATRADLDQLADGINSVCPATFQGFCDLDREESILRAFIASDVFHTRGTLGQRLRAFVASLEDLEHRGALTALVDLELAFAAPLAPDDQVERLNVTLEDADQPGSNDWIRANSGFRLLTFEYDILPLHYQLLIDGSAASWPEKQASDYLIGMFLGQISVIPAPPNVRRAWEALQAAPQKAERVLELVEPTETGLSESGFPDSADGWLFELRRAGAIGITPSL